MAQTIEQLRAENAWQTSANYKKEEVNIAKSLPALIMNSGLMQVLAFAHSKGGEHEKVAADLRAWLHKKFNNFSKSAAFNDFMQALMQAKAAEYKAINSEAFAWLKWLRQMAAARIKES